MVTNYTSKDQYEVERIRALYSGSFDFDRIRLYSLLTIGKYDNSTSLYVGKTYDIIDAPDSQNVDSYSLLKEMFAEHRLSLQIISKTDSLFASLDLSSVSDAELYRLLCHAVELSVRIDSLDDGWSVTLKGVSFNTGRQEVVNFWAADDPAFGTADGAAFAMAEGMRIAWSETADSWSRESLQNFLLSILPPAWRDWVTGLPWARGV